MSRARKLSLDRYITLATRGLPRRERLDTAAELRVHVLERVRELEEQGFPRSEAEHVAVAEMGLPEGTNRAFLGHFFTYRTGWAVLGLLAVGAGAWWGKDNLFPKEAIVSSIPMGSMELASALEPSLRSMDEYQAFRLVMPKGAVGLQSTTFVNGLSGERGLPRHVDVPFASAKTPDGRILPSNYRHEVSFVAGFGASIQHCGGFPIMDGLFNYTAKDTVMTVVKSSLGLTCHRPMDPYGVAFQTNSLSRTTLSLNEWQILWVATMTPDMSGCRYSLDSKGNEVLDPKFSLPDCDKRRALEKDMFSNPAQHWDRYAVVAVRAVDAEHRNDFVHCLRAGHLTVNKPQIAGIGLEPPQPCKS